MVLWLIAQIINSDFEHKIHENLFEFRLTGIPIGNLTSQLFANIYLNSLDQFLKQEVSTKYYIRYMDDFLILSSSKKELFEMKENIGEFLKEKLKLEFHSKKANVFPAEKGIDFLGYVIYQNHRLLRQSTIARFIRRTRNYQNKLDKKIINQKQFDNSLRSWNVYAEFGNSWCLRRNLSEKLSIL